MTKGAILQEFSPLWQSQDGGHPVRSVGHVARYDPQSSRPPHFHGQLELLIVTSGELTFSIGNQVRRVAAPALVWHLPTLHHHTVAASSDCFFWVVMFEPDFAERVLAPLPRIGRSRAVTSLSGLFDRQPTPAPFAGWVLGLTNLLSAQPALEIRKQVALRLEELALLALHLQPAQGCVVALEELLVLAARETERQLSGLRSPSLVELGTALLLSAPDLERAVMCRELDVSASYLARQFRAQAGASFAEFRTRARLVSFLAAAARQETSLLRAALDAGFGSYSQAHRAFSAATGYSPRDYLHHGGRHERALLIAEDARSP